MKAQFKELLGFRPQGRVLWFFLRFVFFLYVIIFRWWYIVSQSQKRPKYSFVCMCEMNTSLKICLHFSDFFFIQNKSLFTDFTAYNMVSITELNSHAIKCRSYYSTKSDSIFVLGFIVLFVFGPFLF